MADKFNACVPDDLILSLKQAEHPKEFLGPPNKRTLKSLSKNPVRKTNDFSSIWVLGFTLNRLKFNYIKSVIKRCDNAWNYEKQRERFKFLTDQPVCSCGAGK